MLCKSVISFLLDFYTLHINLSKILHLDLFHLTWVPMTLASYVKFSSYNLNVYIKKKIFKYNILIKVL